MSSCLFEMEKKTLVLLFLLLTGCSYKSAACVKFDGDKEIDIDIKAVNDDIQTVEISEVFELPYELLANEKEFERFKEQLDVSYHFEDNILIRRYAMVIDDTYSYMDTLKQLNEEKYHCE